MVLGHNKCGAVNGAIDGVELGNLTALLKTAKNTGRRNVQLTMERIHQKSPVMNELMKEGKLKMIGALYDVTSGKIYHEDDLGK